MSAARDEILGRIQSALHDVSADERPEDVSIVRNYRRAGADTRAGLVERFIDRLVDYKAKVQRVMAADLPGTISAACAARGVRRLVVPADLPETWEPAGVTLLRDDELTNRQLDESDGVLSGCALAIAQTGTIVLDSGTAQGRRAITLLPDYHLCVVRAEQIVGLVPEAIERLHGTARRPITFISGPSATSDIELNRVEGVHGPRTLEVLIVDP
jgi:L-lactate dehydrogenase complex protein LldG